MLQGATGWAWYWYCLFFNGSDVNSYQFLSYTRRLQDYSAKYKADDRNTVKDQSAHPGGVRPHTQVEVGRETPLSSVLSKLSLSTVISRQEWEKRGVFPTDVPRLSEDINQYGWGERLRTGLSGNSLEFLVRQDGQNHQIWSPCPLSSITRKTDIH